MNFTITSIAPICRSLKSRGQKIALATGFFDLLHEEHLKFLQNARKAGDVLVVGVESDGRARIVKGEGRPIESQRLRCQKVGSYADYVIVLDDGFNNQVAYKSLLQAVLPDIYAVSSHSSYLENKRQLVEEYGGKLVIVHQHNPTVSTTKILEQGIIK